MVQAADTYTGPSDPWDRHLRLHVYAEFGNPLRESKFQRARIDEVVLALSNWLGSVCLDKKATSISLLVALGVREDGQKVLLAVKNMGGESEAAWRALLDDLVKRGLKMPELVIVDGAPGLEKALAALWSDMPVQRCTVQ